MRGSKVLVALTTSVALVCAMAAPGIAAAGASGSNQAGVLGTPSGYKWIHPATHAASLAKPQPSITPVRIQSNVTVGAIDPKPKVILVFWGTQWSDDYAGAAPALIRFFSGLYGARDTWGTVLDQYCEGVPIHTAFCDGRGTPIVHPTTGPLAGVFFDRTPEPQIASNAQLGAEAVKAAHRFGLTSITAQNTQIVVASPTGLTPDDYLNQGFCAYHDSITSSIGTIAWTNLPYLPDLGPGGCTTLDPATLLDGYFSTETHEYAETATDFTVEPNALGWLARDGEEIGDLCVQLDARETLTTGTFDVQGIWSNAANNCVTSGLLG
jgi:hypothetical protein